MHNEATPKTVTLEAVLSKENLRAAWLAVKANQGAAGVDGMDIERTAIHLREHWETIKAKLLAGTYKPAAVRAVEIPKPNGGVRTLGIPNVQDRLIQQAIHQQVSPLWEAEFSEHSYGFRPNRSAHDAIEAAQGFIQAGKTWVADIDLKSFFDEVSHDILMHQVGQKIRDKRLLRLIGEYLRAPMQSPDGRKIKRNKGTPQGGPLSPLLANIYLDPLDQELEKRGLSFVRYADDVAIFAASERAACRILESVTNWIEKNRKVPVNRDKSGSGPTDESALLGFRLYADGRIGVSPKAIGRMKEKVRSLWDARQSLTSRQLRDQWRRYIRGWWNYFKIATWRREVEDLSGWIRRHIRKCFWVRWKTPRGRINALRRLGVKGSALGIGYSGKGAWAMARQWAVNQALKNATLKRYGFIIPWDFAEAQP
jgi:group II intron reverse transcriptase/maturase